MRDLLKKIYDLWVETNWIKMLQKEERKLERLQDATKRQAFVVDSLRKEFLKTYPLGVRDGN